MPAKLPRANPGSNFVIQGAVWNELADRVELLEGLKVAANSGLELQDQPGGKVLVGKPLLQTYRAITTSEPTDENPFVALARLYSGTTLSGPAFPVELLQPRDDSTVIYVHLPVGGTSSTYDEDDEDDEDPVPVLWRELAFDRVALVGLTGQISGKRGWYTGVVKAMSASMNLEGTDDLVELDLGSPTVECRIANNRETAQSPPSILPTHTLLETGRVPVTFIGVLLGVGSDGVPVYMIDGLQQKVCGT